MDLARLDRDRSRWSDFISDDDLQTPPVSERLLKYRCLGADGEQVPSLKGIDGVAWHNANERSLHVECFGCTPVEPHDRVERWRHASRSRRGLGRR